MMLADFVEKYGLRCRYIDLDGAVIDWVVRTPLSVQYEARKLDDYRVGLDSEASTYLVKR